MPNVQYALIYNMFISKKSFLYTFDISLSNIFLRFIWYIDFRFIAFENFNWEVFLVDNGYHIGNGWLDRYHNLLSVCTSCRDSGKKMKKIVRIDDEIWLQYLFHVILLNFIWISFIVFPKKSTWFSCWAFSGEKKYAFYSGMKIDSYIVWFSHWNINHYDLRNG